MTENAIMLCVQWNPWASTYFKSDKGSEVMSHHFDRERLRLQRAKQVALEVGKALVKSGTNKKIEDVLPQYAAQIKSIMISDKMIQRNQTNAQSIALNAQLNRAVQISTVAGGAYVKAGLKILDQTEKGMVGLEEYNDELQDFDARAKELVRRTDELMKPAEEENENLLAELMAEIELEEDEEAAAEKGHVLDQPIAEEVMENPAPLPRPAQPFRRAGFGLAN